METEKRYAVTVGFFQPGRPQAWFELDDPPVVKDMSLHIAASDTELSVFAPGHWSGFTVKDRGQRENS